ncbi:MAG: hypothetical protein KF851_00320 [Pirellulaceae bacterium]|nr:hypothetical protein [Pirellulaceae bacterium]
MRISELFRLRFWSTGMIAIAMVGSCAFSVWAQSPQASGNFQQASAAEDKLESWLRDAEGAMQQQNWTSAEGFLRVADALNRGSGAPRSDVEMRINQMRAQMPQNSAVPQGMTADSNTARGGDVQLLLEARQALAKGDVASAQSKMLQAKQANLTANSLGDTPEMIQALITRQNQLAEMARSGDPDAYNTQAATFLIEQGERLLAYGDLQTAEFLANQAEKFPVDFTAMSVNPGQLRSKIATAGAQQPSGEIIAVRRLMAEAQLAVDQKNWSEAKRLLTQARAYNLPESAFPADAVRPWQMEMVVDRALRQSGSLGDSFDNRVVSADYDASQDKTRNAQVAMQAIPAQGSPQGQPAASSLSDAPNMSGGPEEVDLSSIRDDEQLLFRKLQQDVFRGRADADRMMKSEPRKALDKMVYLRTSITTSELSPASMAPLLTIVDRDITEMQRFIQANLPQIQLDETNAERLAEVELTRERKYEAELQIQQLVESVNRLMEAKKYSEASDVARQINELAPGSEIASLVNAKVMIQSNYQQMEELNADRAQNQWERFAAVERAANPNATDYEFGDAETWIRNSNSRIANAEARRFNSEADRRIWNKLKNQKIQGEFLGSLRDAVQQIAMQSGENIIFDDLAMAAESIEPSTSPVNASMSQPVSMESALKVLLGNAGLTFVVEDEVIKVTSKGAQYKRLIPKTYYIGDLVTPINNNYSSTSHMYFITPQQQQPNVPGQHLAGGNTPGMPNQAGAPSNVLAQHLPGMGGIGGMGGGLADAAMMNALGSRSGTGGPQTGTPMYTSMGAPHMGGITIGDFFPLIQLIQQTIAPDDWQSSQGEGTIMPYVPNLSLIVSQTQEVHDEIQDLLTQLRKLNDVQIVVEVRFITLRDNFFERIGIDFDFKINDNSGLTAAQVSTTDRFRPSVIVGRDATLERFEPTADLDIGFSQNSIGGVLPTFGGFDPGTAANFGFAILSDVEVFFLLQASKGDTRTNLTTAPTVTMFNGQSASVTDFSLRPFVTSVIPVVGDFAVAQQPVVSLIPDGTMLTVRATASDDRRFVTLALNPYFTKITDVRTFTFDGRRTTRQTSSSFLQDLLNQANPGNGNGNGNDDRLDVETVTEGVTVQQPVTSITSVNTVVSIPDGGTVLIGGIKTLSEARLEKGVPFLSNIPYINRLFKNVGIGRETANLMMMVTPRIIIQEEEERRQVGPVGGGN